MGKYRGPFSTGIFNLCLDNDKDFFPCRFLLKKEDRLVKVEVRILLFCAEYTVIVYRESE